MAGCAAELPRPRAGPPWPAVWLLHYDVWFLDRWDMVRTVLNDWETWSSAGGVGLNPVINEAWKDALICVDPPRHTGMRKLFTDRLGTAPAAGRAGLELSGKPRRALNNVCRGHANIPMRVGP